MQLSEIDIQELLGRNLDLQLSHMQPVIEGKSIMVTGAGGSIGSALVMQLIALKPRVLVLYESSEYALYRVMQRAVDATHGAATRLVPVLGHLGTLADVEPLLEAYRVQHVYHAAAYKHVPMVERNPVPGLRNNVFGTRVLVDAARSTGVPEMVLISTDKAVNPTNVMGASKRMAEYVVLSRPELVTQRYRVVRFGNVLGSTGSVVPLFMRQLSTTRKMTITHKDVTRYFMSIDEAVGLILQSSWTGADISVLDMGVQVRIEDLAHRLAKLMKIESYDIEYIGLRPGEKLYEELTLGEKLEPTSHPLIRAANEFVPTYELLSRYMRLLGSLCATRDIGGIRTLLGQAVPGYDPSCGIVDDLWLEENVFSFAGKLDDCYRTPSPEVV